MTEIQTETGNHVRVIKGTMEGKVNSKIPFSNHTNPHTTQMNGAVDRSNQTIQKFLLKLCMIKILKTGLNT